MPRELPIGVITAFIGAPVFSYIFISSEEARGTGMIVVEHLSGGYEDIPIVKDISFTVEKGKILGILGPNGSGKSTLLKVMSGILPATAGTISIDGQNILSYNARALAKKWLYYHSFMQMLSRTV